MAAARLSGRAEHLLVDGYNVIFSWEDLKALAQDKHGGCPGQADGYSVTTPPTGAAPILVFDAQVKAIWALVEKYHNLNVVIPKEAETADMYIEKATHAIARHYHATWVVTILTPLEQLIILGRGPAGFLPGFPQGGSGGRGRDPPGAFQPIKKAAIGGLFYVSPKIPAPPGRYRTGPALR